MAKNNREFFVETPLGLFRVYAKHDVDLSLDFPGVYVDLVREGEDDIPLACVEYESVDKWIQTVVYGMASSDEPTSIIVHDLSEILTDDSL